jgi:hypothetical protein
MKFRKTEFRKLNARQKENFNFQKVAAILADYGFVSMRLSDDWRGADFIAQHVSGKPLRVQLKGRLALDKRYRGKMLYLAFPDRGIWYLAPHDKLLDKVLRATTIGSTASWKKRGAYSFVRVPQKVLSLIDPYRVSTL